MRIVANNLMKDGVGLTKSFLVEYLHQAKFKSCVVPAIQQDGSIPMAFSRDDGCNESSPRSAAVQFL